VLLQPEFGETLPALLRRRRGIPERRTWLAAAAVVVALLVAYGLLHDPLDGKTQVVHRGKPEFNVLYTPGAIRPVAPRRGELQRYVGRRGPLRVEVAVRPLRLPAYRGDIAGMLPVYSTTYAASLAARLPRFEVTGEGRARVQGAPGYEVAFRFGPPDDRTTGQDVLVVPPDEPGARDGAIISYRERRGGVQPGARTKAVLKAARSAFRSFKFGTDRDD
jgi:hypothetical protein